MVKIENLSFNYRRDQILFEDLNLTLASGNIYGLLGKNGAGKSSLLKIIAGMVFPHQGKLDVAGYRPKDRLPHFLQDVYLISEEFYLPSMYLKDYVKFYSPFYPGFNMDLFHSYLNEFQLPIQQKLTAMSYGQKKKFILSFGLATNCKLLIMDEPTNGLDIPSKSQFRKIVASAIHEERSFIISTHQVRDMENLIDPIIILDEGQIIFFQDYEQVSAKLTFGRQVELPDENSVLYNETSLSGFTVVKANTTGEETKINLELLFNAVISNKEDINKLFKS